MPIDSASNSEGIQRRNGTEENEEDTGMGRESVDDRRAVFGTRAAMTR